MLILVRKYQMLTLSKCIKPFCLPVDRLDSNKSYSTLLGYSNNRYDKFVANTIRPSPFYQNNNLRSFSIQSFLEWQQNIYTSISHSTPVAVCQDAFINVHSLTELPWWFTITFAAVFVRLVVTMPLIIYANKISAKVENLRVEFHEIIKELNLETAAAKKQFNLNEKQLFTLYNMSMKKQWQALIVRDNCHPLKATIVFWIQIPLWVSMTFALRNLLNMQPIADAFALITFTELTVGGFGWMPNLTDVDHSLILPVVLGITNLLIIEIQSMSRLQSPSKLGTRVTNIFRAITFFFAVISAYVPSALSLYWTASSAAALAQNLMILSPKVKRKCGIPKTPSEREYPYAHLVEQFGQRLKFIGSKLRLTTKP